MLAVHGYTDYFFHTELADHFAAAASPSTRWTCTNAAGRGATARRRTSSPTSPTTTPNSIRRWPVIASTPAGQVLLYGHSAGGLIVSLWLDRLRRRDPAAHAGVGGLVLNSPFLDLPGPPILRHSATWR